MDNKFGENQGKLNRGNGGFSLIEVIVSVVILAIVSIPLIKYFSDSLQSSIRMAQRQQATVLAQQVTEMMKAQDQLIQKADDGSYQVPILMDEVEPDEDGLNIGGLGLVLEGSGFNAEGTGEAIYVTPTGDASYTNPFGYDIRVTVSTDVSANQVQRPLVYGLDDGTDVLALETNQQTEALTYFSAAHFEYCADHPEMTPLTSAQIAKLIDRTIKISIVYDSVEKNYLVRVWYEYTVDALSGVNWISPDLVSSLASEPWTSSYLADDKMTTVSGIYLLYDKQGAPMKTPGEEEAGTDEKNDIIYVIVDSSTAEKLKVVPDLYLICQKPTYNSNYKLMVDWTNCKVQILDVKNDLDHKHHSNITSRVKPIPDAGSDADPDDDTKKITGTLRRRSPELAESDLTDPENELTSTGTPTRIVSIETEVYKMGTFEGGTIDSDDPLAVIKTTKGG